MRRLRIGLMLAIVGSAVLSGPVTAGTRPEIHADLEGKAIEPSEIGSYFCHDFEYPYIHCFESADELEAAISGDFDGYLLASFGPNDYVTIYADPSYAGSYAHLSQNYDTLFWIGWNDRISSFKGRNSASGVFWTDWYASGSSFSFCCNQQVPYLPTNLDNTFTSVYRR